MSTNQPPPLPLQKPPGYKEPDTPIPLPPPPQHKSAAALPPSLHHKSRRSICCRTFCCCFCIFHAILLLLFIAAIAFFYLHYNPHPPQIHLKSITFTKFDVIKGPTLDAQSTIVVEIKNPNQKLSMDYDKAQILLSTANGAVNLGQQTMNGFTQGKNNVTTLRVSMKAKKEVIISNKDAQMLKNGVKDKSLAVDAEVRSGVGMKGSGWSTGKVPVTVVCGGVSLNGGATPKCRIRIFNWFYIN